MSKYNIIDRVVNEILSYDKDKKITFNDNDIDLAIKFQNEKIIDMINASSELVQSAIITYYILIFYKNKSYEKTNLKINDAGNYGKKFEAMKTAGYEFALSICKNNSLITARVNV